MRGAREGEGDWGTPSSMFGRLDISAHLANRDQEHRGVCGAECPMKHPRVPAVRTNTRVYRKK